MARGNPLWIVWAVLAYLALRDILAPWADPAPKVRPFANRERRQQQARDALLKAALVIAGLVVILLFGG